MQHKLDSGLHTLRSRRLCGESFDRFGEDLTSNRLRLVRRLGKAVLGRRISGFLFGCSFPTGHLQDRKEVEYFVVIDEVHTLRMETDKVRTVLAMVATAAMIDAE